MKKQILFAACTLFAASALLMTSCQQAEEPIANDPTDQAGPMTRAATLGNFYRVVYVEVNDVQSAQRRRISPVGRHSVLYARHSLCIQHPRRRIGQCPQLQQPEQRRNPRKSRQVHRAAPGKRYQGHHGQPRRPHRCRIRQPTAAQIGTYTDDLVAYDNIVDGYDFDDEWAEYGTRGYPYANSTSYSNMIIALAGKTNKSISVFDWGNTGTLSSTAISHLDWGCQGTLNGYGFNSSFAKGQYLPLFVDLTGPLSDNQIKSYTTAAKNANARGVAFFNLPMSSYRLSSFNAAAQAFGETVSHTGKTYSKDYGN